MEQERSAVEAPDAAGVDASRLQAHTLLAFTAIYASHGACNRRFALCLDAELPACAAALALTSLGGACLLMDAEPRRLHLAGRLGATDFTVSDLSEALRILKNELRKGTPVSVGLLAGAEACIAELLRRGVQPDLVCGTSEKLPGLQPFVAQGAASLLLPALQPVELAGARLASNSAENMAQRRKQDHLMQARWMERTAGDQPLLREIQSRWLSVAPRLFRAERSRVYWQMENDR